MIIYFLLDEKQKIRSLRKRTLHLSFHFIIFVNLYYALTSEIFQDYNTKCREDKKCNALISNLFYEKDQMLKKNRI